MMKSTFTLFALFFLVAITTHLPSATAQDVVFDTDGNPLRSYGAYYILPVLRGSGGGIELAQTGNDTCPLTVAQSHSEASFGIPITISSPIFILNIIEGIRLKLHFRDTDLPSCVPTPANWNVKDEQAVKGWSIKVSDDSEKKPGWFSIQKFGHGAHFYKLVFSSHDDVVSRDIGIDSDSDGTRRLVVMTKYNKFPFLVQFKSVHGSSVAV
ncbi:hypothetical protein RIF29_29663 [Crotalaria pallida]|uniref:Uncharacterized protein n=1 Tax=Crotalaria pallida TaxID=3830 RepID=A0AAN9HXN3_CROPI